MIRPYIGLPKVASLLVSLICLPQSHAQDAATIQGFEKKIAEYESIDRSRPPVPGAILLVGDSQLYRWKSLNDDLPGYRFVNRAIDSFQFSDLIRYFDRLVKPYRPRMILVHAGGNDVHKGKDADRVAQDFATFIAQVHALDPDIKVVFSSITPGPGRWDEAAIRVQANAAIAQYTRSMRNVYFVDLWNPMLSPAGQPREDLWVEDRVHPNHEGYQLRAAHTKPHLDAPDLE